MNNGLVTKILQWLAHPYNSDENTTVLDWVVGLGIVLIVAFLWSQVVGQIE